MARMVIQSEKSQNKVAKFCYAVQGLYHIIRNTGHVSYYIKIINTLDSPELKFIAYDLYPLPSSLKPYDLSISLTLDIPTKPMLH